MASASTRALGFDVVLKIVERCNLACPNCYYFEKEYDASRDTAIMDQAVALEISRFLTRSIEQLPLTRLNVVFHGGEPLLMPKKRFRALCESIRDTLANRVDLVLSLQTNGVLIDEDWIKLFEEFDIFVGISIDGPQKTHDRRRPTPKGTGSYERAVAGLRLLQNAANAGKIRRVGILCTLDGDGDDENLLKHLIFNLGVSTPNFNFPRGGWNASDVLH